MPDPTGNDTLGEYIIITSAVTGPIDLTNWELDDGGAPFSLSGSLAAGDSLKICRDTSVSSTATGCDVEWSGMELTNSGDTITLKDDNSDTIDSVSYASSTQGIAIGFHAGYSDMTVHNVDDDLYFATVQDALDASTTDANEVIELTADLTIGAEIQLDKAITLEGNGYTIDAAFTKTSNSNNSAIGVGADDVTIQNLMVDGDNGTNLHGINAYEVTGLTVSGVTVMNFRTGLLVNGSTVNVDDITTSGNSWHGINVDLGSGVSDPAVLNISNTSSHTELVPHIFVDDTTKNVTVNDIDGQYFYIDNGDVRSYFLNPEIYFCKAQGNDSYHKQSADIEGILHGLSQGGINLNNIIPPIPVLLPDGLNWDDGEDLFNNDCGEDSGSDSVADGPDSSIYDDQTNTDQMCIEDEPDATYQDQVIAAADRLLALQHDDGSWGWGDKGQTGPTGNSYYNVAGVSAEALLDAYVITLDSTYLDAAEDAGDYLIANYDEDARQNAFNAVFLYDLASVSGDSSYAAQADMMLEHTFIEENYWSSHNGSYCSASGCSAAELTDALQDFRSSLPGLSEWDLHTFVLALVDTDNMSLANELQDEIQATVDGYSGSETYYILGLASALRAAVAVGDATAMTDDINALLAEQNGDGSFSTSDGNIQPTAYALLALHEAGQDSAAAAAAAYLSDQFGYTDGGSFDGWLDGGEEYAEVDSEAAHALAQYIYNPNAVCPQYATVTMCKVDQSDTSLPGWTLMLKGDEVENLNVAAVSAIGANTSNILTAGQSYLAEVTGNWDNAGGNGGTGNKADAEYVSNDDWATHTDGPAISVNNLDLQVNNDFVDWGTYNSGHNYAYSFIPGAVGTANFRIFDGTGTIPNASWYTDNSGTLNVSLSEGYAGITGKDGCVTFEDVPYGDYTVDEVNQDGWYNVSGLGTVTVDQESEEFTVTNTDDQTDLFCRVTVVSDDTNEVEETDDFAKLLTFIHPSWTATIADADWIWGDDPVALPVQDQTQTFTKTFEWSGGITSAVLDIAADNYYTVYLNGIQVASDQVNKNNFQSGTQDQYDVASYIVPGVNTLKIEVTNAEGSSQPQSNPAGLKYNLTVTGDEEGDACMSAPINPGLEITDPDTDYTELSGSHTFKAEYVDADSNPDPVQWAIRAGTCNANTNTVAGNVDGFNTPFSWDGASFSTDIDMSTWDNGDYCLVVNPSEDSGTNFRETRWFTLNNPIVATCEPEVNLLANPSFEEPDISGVSKKWDLVDPVGWLVERLNSSVDLDMEIQRGYAGWSPSEGAQWSELDGSESSIFTQILPTVADKEYTLTWDFSPRPGRGTIDNQLDVLVNSSKVEHNQADGTGLNDTDWTTGSYSFTGDGNDVEIQFADGGTSNSYGPFLDNVSLTCNPNTGTVSYCGDGEINDEWEQCEPGDDNCNDYCLYDNQCHDDVQLVKFDLDDTTGISNSWNGKVYLGDNNLMAPMGYWINVNEFGTSSVMDLAKTGFDGLAVDYDGSQMRFAWRGDNASKVLDYVQGQISFYGFDDIVSDDVDGEINGTTFKLEKSGQGFPDVFDPISSSTIDVDMRADVGNDGVTLDLRDGPLCEEEDNNGNQEESTYTVYGHVFNDENQDTVKDSGESYLNGVTVSIDNGTTTMSTTTDSSGYYFFDVVADDYTVSASTTMSYSLPTTTGNTYEVTVASTTVNGPYDFGLYNLVITTTSNHTSGNDNGPATSAAPEPDRRVLGASTNSCSQYLTKTIRPGGENDPEEVTRLQRFLRDLEGHPNVPVNGVYGSITQQAVWDFQNKYFDEVLAPWGLTLPTKIVYYTTRKTINEIYCDFTEQFPLTSDQQSEIEWYRNLGLSFRSGPSGSPQSGQGQETESGNQNEGGEVNEEDGSTGGSGEGSTNGPTNNGQGAAASDAGGGFWHGFTNFFKSWFGSN